MTLSLRYRIVLTLIPLLVLLAVLGTGGIVLLYRLGGRLDLILRENYDSVIAMERLNEALERIDSSFQFALAGRLEPARQQYEANWPSYLKALELEEHNVTLPGEAELVAQLTELTKHYQRQGDQFYAERPLNPEAYFGPNGLLDRFKKIKEVSNQILLMNQQNMKDESRDAQRMANDSLIWFGVGLAVAVVLAGWSAAHTIRMTLRPIQAVTQSALAIGHGNLDQVVPVLAHDELGQLADAFNSMARQLRLYRKSDYSRLLRAQRQSQATIDSFPDPVLVLDSEGRVEIANPAARRLFGVSGEGPDHMPGPIWEPPAPLQQPLQAALRKLEPFVPDGFDRITGLRLNGQEHYYLPRILPIQDPYGNTLGAAVLLQDITRFRLLDEVKTDLVATVSHELKTPLTSIRLAVHLLLEEVVGPLTPKQTELLLDARDSAERLLARVNNLLDLARLEQKLDRLDLRGEPPADLLQNAADNVRARAEAKDIQLVVEVPPDMPLVAVDAPRLSHALDNLLDNALTYTERGGRITLAATSADGWVTLTVRDTGVGIPAEYLPHVFEKFFRVPGQSKGSGTGLGLAIVRELVHANGGTIRCESQVGKGTTFAVSLPVWKEPAPETDQTLLVVSRDGERETTSEV